MQRRSVVTLKKVDKIVMVPMIKKFMFCFLYMSDVCLSALLLNLEKGLDKASITSLLKQPIDPAFSLVSMPTDNAL